MCFRNIENTVRASRMYGRIKVKIYKVEKKNKKYLYAFDVRNVQRKTTNSPDPIEINPRISLSNQTIFKDNAVTCMLFIINDCLLQ